MSTGKIVLLSLAALFVGLVIYVVSAYVSNYNYGNRAERQLEATWTNNKNVLSQYTLRVSEMAQVTDMMRDDVATLIQDAFTGRHGENGSQAVLQFITENNPTIDAELYNRLQQTIEAGRNEFKNSQTLLIDQRRSYETNLGYLVKGFWLSSAGYPKVDLTKYDPVTSVQAEETFETGVDNGLTLRPGSGTN